MININIYSGVDEKKIPLVWFHGFGFDHRIFLPFVSHFLSERTSFLVDLPGFGKTAPMHEETFIKNLALRLPDRFIVLGWSLGGLYAIRLAAALREQVKALFLLASSPCFIQKTGWPGILLETMIDFSERLHKNRAETLNAFIDLQCRGRIGRQGMRPSMGDMTEAGLILGLTALKDWDERLLMRSLSLPIFCLFGGVDAIVPRKLFDVMREDANVAKLVCLKSASHMPFLSHPKATAEWLLNLFKEGV